MENIVDKIKTLAFNLADVEKNVSTIEKLIRDLSNKKEAIEKDIERLLVKKANEFSELQSKKDSFEKWLKDERSKLSEESRKIQQILLESDAKKKEADSLFNKAANKAT